jgi:hypothetical protein
VNLDLETIGINGWDANATAGWRALRAIVPNDVNLWLGLEILARPALKRVGGVLKVHVCDPVRPKAHSQPSLLEIDLKRVVSGPLADLV